MKIIVKPYWKRQDGWVIAALGLVLSAVGTAAGMAGQAKARNAQQRARNDELYRQSQYQKKAAEIVAQQTRESTADKAEENIDQAAQQRQADYNRITGTIKPPTRAVTSTTQSAPLARVGANQSAVASAWNRIIGGAQGRLGAYDDWGLSRNIAQQRGAQDIGLIGRNARGSAGVSAAEQQDAAHSGDALIAGGQLLGLAGQGLGAYAATTPQAGAIEDDWMRIGDTGD